MTAERIQHVLEAFAFGDAIGMPTQLYSHEEALAIIGTDGVMASARVDHKICPGLAGATITDDTHQLLILADNLIETEGDFDSVKFALALLEWETRMIAAGSKDLLGPSTKTALLALAGARTVEAVSFAGTTNGGAMRIPALACSVPILSVAGANAIIEKIIAINRLSHNSSAANIGCAAVATMISAGIDGLDFELAIDTAIAASQVIAEQLGASSDENYIELRLKDVLFEVERAALEHDDSALRYIVTQVGTSMQSEESVLAAFAVASLARYQPFNTAILGAKLGGDSDTIAAIGAAIAAAFGHWDDFDEKAATAVRVQNDLEFGPRARALAALRENYRDEL
ncbi:MAG: ADP-ribosylglycohydrolase family protein [Micrococcales bacterium]